MIKYLFPLLILSSLLLPRSSAQGNYEIVGSAQGLSQGMINDIFQDSKGYFWFATKEGLNKYDGYEFTVYGSFPFDSTSLASNFVKKIYEDSYGLKWLLTESNGISIMNPSGESFVNLNKQGKSKKAGLSNDDAKGIIEIEPGRILVFYDDSLLDEITFTYHLESGIANISVRYHSLPEGIYAKGIAKGKDQTLWIGGSDLCIYTLDPKNFQLTKKFEGYSFTASAVHPSDGSIWAVGLDKKLFYWKGEEIQKVLKENYLVKEMRFEDDNHLWIGGFSGLIRLTLPECNPLCDTKEIKLQTFLTQLIYSLWIDSSRLVWAGTGGKGVIKIFTQENQFSNFLTGESARHISVLADEKLYIGKTWSKWMHLEDGKINPTPLSFKGIAEEIENFLCPNANTCYLVTQREFIHFKDEVILSRFPIKDKVLWEKSLLRIDEEGWVYISSPDGLFYRYNPVSKELKRFSYRDLFKNLLNTIDITAFSVDKFQNIWLGTNNGFVWGKFNRTTLDYEFELFVSRSGDKNSLSLDPIACFLQDRDFPEFTYIGTKGGGLNIFNSNFRSFEHLGTFQGLPNNNIYGLLFDNKGRIWGSTNKGIFALTLHNKNRQSFLQMKKVDGKFLPSYEIVSFSKYDGLQDNEFNSHSYAALSDGRLVFGGINGLTIFHPSSIATNTFAPNVEITKVLSNNQLVIPKIVQIKQGDSTFLRKKILLSHEEKIITFEFASLDFHHPYQNKFRYKMKDIDPIWREGGTQRNATYVNLKPGKYTFYVQGSNSSGIWSPKIDTIELQILPPFWKTIPAFVVYGVLSLLLLKLLIDFYSKRKNLQFEIIYGQKEAKRMKELSQFKTEFFTNITHELRTPLTIIMGLSNELRNSQHKESAQKAQSIYHNSHNLVKMVNQLLDVAKIESGKLEVIPTQGDIVQETKSRIHEILPLCTNKGIQIHFFPNKENLTIQFDFSIFSKVLTNLLSNSIKFTPPNGNIYVFLEKNNQDTDETLILKVQDTGPGIPKDQQELIFEKFYQVTEAAKEVNTGSGIGLSLCRELLDLVNGSISVKSPVEPDGAGALFTVTFPINFEKKRQNTPLPIPTASTRSNAPLILLVEDNEDILEYLKICLKDFSTAVARNGKEGFLSVKKLLPDLVISDIMMPEEDGISLCQSIRSEESTNHIPIILLSAKTGFEQRIAGLNAGANEYIEKPFHSEELLARIHKIFEQKKQLSAFFKKQMGLSAESEDLTIFAQTPSKTEDAFIQKVKQIIEENYANPEFTVETLSKKVFLSYRQLHRKLESISGIAPNSLITLTRLNKAQKELIEEPEKSIALISAECGFKDPSYFSRIFKKHFGKGPAEWRKNKTMPMS